MARQRKPTALKLLEGNPGKRPIRKNEAQPEGTVRMPSWLSQGARRLWKRHAPELVRLGLLSTLDVEAFASWCEQSALAEECTQRIEREGITVHSFGQEVAHPCIGMRLKAITAARQLAATLGLSPSARAGLDMKAEAAENGFLAWQREHGK